MSEKDMTVFKTLIDAQIKSGKAVAYEKAVRAKLKAEKFEAVKPDKP